jgi:hypothetical protein
LCGTPDSQRAQVLASRAESLQKDLDSRIEDVATAALKHRLAAQKQWEKIGKIRDEKAELDHQLVVESQTYDSNYLARSREVERTIATRTEQIKGLERAQRLPEMVRTLEVEGGRLQGEINNLKKQISAERGRLTQSSVYVREIEQRFLEALVSIGLPGVSADDVVTIDTKTWIPSVLPRGDESLEWSFDNAGSGGKKTLFKVCYALAVHQVAAGHALPLPHFLIIDTPMKNIGEDVNEDLFRSFYSYLYSLAAGPLKTEQFVVVDKEFYQPQIDGVEVEERFMTPDDPKHPPLISYYRGP